MVKVLTDNAGLEAQEMDLEPSALGVREKSGQVPAGNFTGSPRTAAVVFDTAFPDGNYVVTPSGTTDGRSWGIESQTATGFTINTHASAPLTGPVNWSAEYKGETA